MTFLIDENVSFGLVERLRTGGHQVVSIVESQQQGLSDDKIFTTAQKTKAVIVTRDHHFTNAIHFPAEKTVGIIYIRHGNLCSEEEIKLVEDFLAKHSSEQYCGKLVLLTKDEIYIR